MGASGWRELDTGWRELGTVPPAELTEARLQLHWAVQMIPALADACLARAADDSHSNAEWVGQWGALVGHRLRCGSAPERQTEPEAAAPGTARPAAPAPTARTDRITRAARVGVRLSDLTLIVSEGDVDRPEQQFPLDRRTLAEGLEWAAARVAEVTGSRLTPALREYEMPRHAAGSGGRFSAAEREALEEIGRWYANADAALRALAARERGASPVVCWPHHFDIATLIPLDPGADPEVARSIGVGLSPGDASYPEPYWYVSPWPRPSEGAPKLPLAGGGEWASFGAVLRGSALVLASTQPEAVTVFLDSAIEAAHAVLND